MSEACVGGLPLETIVAIVRYRMHSYRGRLSWNKMVWHASSKVGLSWRQLAIITLRAQHLARLVGVNRTVSLHSRVTVLLLMLIVVLLGVSVVDDHAFSLRMPSIHREIVARIAHKSVRKLVRRLHAKLLIHQRGRPAKVLHTASIQRL